MKTKCSTLKMSELKITLRRANSNDLLEMQKLFVDTIKAICCDDYTQAQIEVWTSTIDNKQRWRDKLVSQYFLVAEVDSEIVGFASLENDNCLDLMYVHKNYQRKGVAKALYSAIEKEAILRNSVELKSDVSETARPFFEKMGFRINSLQINVISEVEIQNYKMVKPL
ncbi:GNAT family N-acetyltransferase [bacterium]|nr:GNAT family N-acetyltransferase [bacterium]